MGNILDSIPFIDTISIIDGKSKKKLLTLTTKDDSFSEMTNIYRSYYDLKRSDRKVLLKKDPFIEIQYSKNNDTQFTVSVFRVEDRYIPILPSEFSTEMGTYSYTYSFIDSNNVYIFVIEELNQLLALNEDLKVPLDNVIPSIED